MVGHLVQGRAFSWVSTPITPGAGSAAAAASIERIKPLAIVAPMIHA
jgi:hypothetical protein